MKPYIPATSDHPADHVVRAALACARNIIEAQGEGAESIGHRDWPHDHRLHEYLKTRGAVVPTTTAAGLGATAVGDLLMSNTASASSALLRSLNPLRLGREASIFVPALSTAPGGMTFVAQGAPIPIRMRTLNGVSLVPKKLAGGVALTRELLISSNAEALLRQALLEDIGPGADVVMFDATIADATRPGGLRAGVAAITATAGGGENAYQTDMAALLGAVAGIGGPITIVASRDVAVKINLRANPRLAYPVLPSGGLAPDTLIAVATNAIAIAANPEPRIDVADEQTLHMEGATPLPIADGAGVLASPTRSLWQTDAIGIRVIMDVDWILRVPNAVSWITGVTW